jgi:hypothetical protein
MEHHKVEHPLVALQFNLGAAARPSQKRQSGATSEDVDDEGGSVSIHVRRHLICEYLKQSLNELPAFVALHDGLSSEDVYSVRDILDERGGAYECVAYYNLKDIDGERKKLPPGKNAAALLYDSNLLIHDTDNALNEDDFFHGRDSKAKRLFKRLDGGLFLHNPSNRWIVAVSYHGEKKDAKDYERKEYISGKNLLVSLRLIIRVAIEFAQKIPSQNTNVYDIGRFQLRHRGMATGITSKRVRPNSHRMGAVPELEQSHTQTA